MSTGHPRRLRPTARLRLSVMYGAAFLACGAAVLAVVAYVLFGSAADQSSSSPSKPAAAAVIGGQFPAASVHQVGGYDIVPVRIPIADVRHDGRYDTVDISVPLSGGQAQPSSALTPAEQARLAAQLLAKEQVHANFDKREILIFSAIALASIALAAAAIGWITAGRVLRPLSTITTAARRIAASSLHERLALTGPDDELKELADTLDSLFARLEGSFDAQRRFAANASHELRTPLTRERTLLQVTLADASSTSATWRAVSRELLASNAEQERLIEALLTLASSEADAGERVPVDLAAIARQALTAARPAISSRGLNVLAAISAAVLTGDPQLVHQLATNLIGNAVRHNISGGDIQVSTSSSHAGAVLSVANSGPVISPAEVDRLFQPFARLGPRPARDGHGLGLSIVRAIAESHGAVIVARARPEGGLAVDVSFPASPDQLAASSAAIASARLFGRMSVQDSSM